MKKIISIALLSLLTFNSCSCLADIDTSKIEINTQPIVLNSKLKKEYSGYEYTITNYNKEKINIINAQMLNGYDGNYAYNAVSNGAGGPIGVTWAIAGPVGLFTLGIGWVAGIIATPIVWLVSKSKDKKARKESLPYTNIIPIGYVGVGDSINIKTLVPIGSKAQLKLSIIDEKTKEIHTIVR